MTNLSLINQLVQFGLSSLEAQIYLHLVGQPPKSILDIARELNVPRTSIYDNALKLSEKGLVQKIVLHKSQQLKAYPLSILQSQIDKERVRVEHLQKELSDLESKVSLTNISPLATEVRYYRGVKGLQQMIWNTLQTKDELIGYSQFGLVNVVSERFTKKYATELIRRQIHNRVVTNPQCVAAWQLKLEPLASYRQSLQQCRVIDSQTLYVSGDTTIYNNVFAAAYWDRGEVVGVEIENTEIVKTQRSMFDLIWRQAKIVTRTA